MISRRSFLRGLLATSALVGCGVPSTATQVDDSLVWFPAKAQEGYVIPADTIRAIWGDLTTGHASLDRFVNISRRHGASEMVSWSQPVTLIVDDPMISVVEVRLRGFDRHPEVLVVRRDPEPVPPPVLDIPKLALRLDDDDGPVPRNRHERRRQLARRRRKGA